MWWSVLLIAYGDGRVEEGCPDCDKGLASPEARWVTGPWGPCTVEGQQQRPVWCLDANRAIASRESCEVKEAPIETQPCPSPVVTRHDEAGVPLELPSSGTGDRELAEALAGIRDFETRLEAFGHHGQGQEGLLERELLPPVPLAAVPPPPTQISVPAADDWPTPAPTIPPTLPPTPTPTPPPTL